jgi:hypothetical protein
MDYDKKCYLLETVWSKKLKDLSIKMDATESQLQRKGTIEYVKWLEKQHEQNKTNTSLGSLV